MTWWRKKEDYPQPAEWPLALPRDLAPERVEEIRRRVDDLSDRAQYGWGHTINFGPFTKEGVMKDNFLHIVGHLDAWAWWPKSLQGLRIADIGCLAGAITAIMAHRGAAEILAVDEIPEHTDQCAYVAEVFGLKRVKTLTASLYRLPELGVGRFDLILLSGVLYHLSDMLVGLYLMRELLRVGGTLLIESTAVDDGEHSYANFGRFARGMWWEPSTLCLKDMCEFMGLAEVEVRMYWPDRALARAKKLSDDPITFKRGLNYPFTDLRDGVARHMDVGKMARK
jgi:SAM-dependent methyltransferase